MNKVQQYESYLEKEMNYHLHRASEIKKLIQSEKGELDSSSSPARKGSTKVEKSKLISMAVNPFGKTKSKL